MYYTGEFRHAIGAMFIFVLSLLPIGFCLITVVWFFISPDSGDVIKELNRSGFIKKEFVNGELKTTIVDERIIPLVKLWHGNGISVNGNVIEE